MLIYENTEHSSGNPPETLQAYKQLEAALELIMDWFLKYVLNLVID